MSSPLLPPVPTMSRRTQTVFTVRLPPPPPEVLPLSDCDLFLPIAVPALCSKDLRRPPRAHRARSTPYDFFKPRMPKRSPSADGSAPRALVASPLTPALTPMPRQHSSAPRAQVASVLAPMPRQHSAPVLGQQSVEHKPRRLASIDEEEYEDELTSLSATPPPSTPGDLLPHALNAPATPPPSTLGASIPHPLIPRPTKVTVTAIQNLRSVDGRALQGAVKTLAAKYLDTSLSYVKQDKSRLQTVYDELDTSFAIKRFEDVWPAKALLTAHLKYTVKQKK